MAKKSKNKSVAIRPTRQSMGGVEKSEMLRSAEGDDSELSDEDRDIIEEAYERFNYCNSWERDFRNKFIADVKFANADPDNGWQWPDDLRNTRMLQRKPTLTINKTQNHVGLIVNDGRMNKAAIEIKPAGKESSFQSATALAALCRNIEYLSTATAIYDDMSQNQVEGGIGYGRIISVYPDPRSFDQELRISPVENHLNVYLDPDIKQKSGSDALYGFIFSDVPDKQYEREFKKKAPTNSAPLGMGLGADWIKDNHVRVAEYYRIQEIEDELVYYKHGDKEQLFLRSEVPDGMRRALRLDEAAYKAGTAGPDIEIRVRPTTIKKLQWFKIGAHEILDREEYPTQYVPIFRFVGRERVIEGKLERKGIVRTLKDAQRMYNYNASAEAEAAALATKTNWLLPLESIAGNEKAWNNSNVENKPVLTYRHKDRDGDPLPPPQRVDPAKEASAYMAGMEIAAREFEMASGQGPAQFGKPTKERSGRAINETQKQGEILTFDFGDNQSYGIQYVGMILLDWIPHCYKTKQVVQVLDKDGTERSITIDPTAETPYEEQKVEDQVQAVLNPKIGRYKVQAQSGPAYATQRQEAWNAFVQIITGAPELINEIGDLMFLSADFPMADEIAIRIRRKIKQMAPWLLEDGAKNPQVQQLEQQLQMAGQQLQEIMQQLATKDMQLKDKSEANAINAAKVSDQYRSTDVKEYDAHTKRISAVTNAQLDLSRIGEEGYLDTFIKSVMSDVLTNQGKTDMDRREPVPDPSQNPQPGDDDGDILEPQLAEDGNHYIRRSGQHFMVDLSGGAAGGQPAE